MGNPYHPFNGTNVSRAWYFPDPSNLNASVWAGYSFTPHGPVTRFVTVPWPHSITNGWWLTNQDRILSRTNAGPSNGFWFQIGIPAIYGRTVFPQFGYDLKIPGVNQ